MSPPPTYCHSRDSSLDAGHLDCPMVWKQAGDGIFLLSIFEYISISSTMSIFSAGTPLFFIICLVAWT